jgi:hypothetical protein
MAGVASAAAAAVARFLWPRERLWQSRRLERYRGIVAGAMPFTWPEFSIKEPFDGSGAAPGVTPLRGWTATFDSYDQYRELCYYRVTLLDGDRAVGALMAKLATDFAGDDWSTPAFANELRRGIARIAATGETNTEYRG